MRPLERIGHTQILAALLLPVLCVLVYLPALHGPFLFDDHFNIDPARIDTLSIASLRQAALSNNSGMLGRPIAAISFALNDYFGTENSTFAFKATNLLLHLVSGALVYALARIVFSFSVTSGRRSWIAFIVCALWLLHPLQVSTVMYTVQRMAQFSAIFSLISLLCYVRARGCGVAETRACVGWLVGAVASAVLACLAKENGVLIPLYLLCLEATVLRHRQAIGTGAVTRRLGICVSLGCIAGLTIVLASLIPQMTDSYQGREFDLFGRLHAQLHALVRYAGWILIPDTTSMTFYYDSVSPPSAFGLRSTVCAVALAGMLTYAYRVRRAYPTEAFGILFFFAAHALESTFIPLELIFEHRNYLASLGLLVTAVAMIGRLLEAGSRGRRHYLVPVVIAGILSSLTLQRASVWADPVAIALESTINTPRSERAWIDLANALLRQGSADLAMRTFADGLEKLPENAHIELQRLKVSWALGIDDMALLDATLNALRTDSLTPSIAMLLARMSEKLERGLSDEVIISHMAALFDAAWESADHRMSIQTGTMFTFHHHRFLLADRRVADALAAITRASRLMPDNGEVQVRLAETLVMAGRPKQAARALSRATDRPFAHSVDQRLRFDEVQRRIDLLRLAPPQRPPMTSPVKN